MLPAGKYKVCVYYGGGARVYQEDVDYFGTGPAPAISSAADNSTQCRQRRQLHLGSGPDKGRTVTGNSTYQDGPWTYPDTFDSDDNGETRWVDVEVTSASSGPPRLPPWSILARS